METLSGTGVYVYYNSNILVMRIQVNGLTFNNPATEISGISLPAGVTPNTDIPVMIPLMNNSWYPTDHIAYLNFAAGNQKPNIRVAQELESVTGAVLRGTFVFPISQFTVPT